MDPLWEYVCHLCLHYGVSPEEASDCTSEVMLRYQQRTGAFPQDEETPNLRLLHLLAQNIVREHQRTCLRRQKLEQAYCEQQQCQHASAPTPMARAIAYLDCEQFHASLPDYLRQTLRLMQQGYSAKEIAEQLGVAAGTVYAYQHELRQRFVEFFGYDPRKSGVRVVNCSDCSEEGSQNRIKEVHDETTSEEIVE